MFTFCGHPFRKYPKRKSLLKEDTHGGLSQELSSRTTTRSSSLPNSAKGLAVSQPPSFLLSFQQLTSTAPSSLLTCSYCSAVIDLVKRRIVSAKKIPLPLMVRLMTVGFLFTVSASSMATRVSTHYAPSISITCQPKPAHLGGNKGESNLFWYRVQWPAEPC